MSKKSDQQAGELVFIKEGYVPSKLEKGYKPATPGKVEGGFIPTTGELGTPPTGGSAVAKPAKSNSD